MDVYKLAAVLSLEDKLSGPMGKAGGVMTKVIGVAAGLGAAVVGIGTAMFKTAADIGEAENVTNLAFGTMGDSVRTWASDFRDATGVSKFEAQEMASTLGLMIGSMGFTKDAAAGMSQQMVELAADMLSAHNIPLADAMDKIKAGLIGSSEPLRSVGVLLSENAVKQEAYASGIALAGSKLTEQEKVQARMNLILQQTESIQGDLVNTQDSAANQARALTTRFSDMWKSLSVKLMPVLTDVFGILLGIITPVLDLAQGFLDTEHSLDGVVPKVVAFITGNETLQSIIAALTPVVMGLWDVLQALGVVLVPIIQWVGVGLVQAVELAAPLLQWLGETVGTVAGAVADGIEWFAALIPGVDSATESVGDLATAIEVGQSPGLTPALRGAGEEIEAFNLKNVRMTGQIQQNTMPAIRNIGGLLEASGVQAHDAALAWGFFADETGTGVPDAMDLVMGSMLEVPPTAEQVDADLRLVAPTWGQTLVDGLGSTFSVENVGTKLSAAFTGGGGWMGAAQALGAEAGAVIGGAVQDKLGGLIAGILPPGLAAAAGPAVQAAMALGKKIWGGIKSMFGGGTNAAEDAYQSVVDASAEAAATDVELQTRTNEAIERGYDERAAAVEAMFVRVRTEQGRTWTEATAEFQRFHHAQMDSASESEKAWTEATAAQLQTDYAALAEQTVIAAAEAEAWAASHTAQTVTDTAMTDEAIANSGRLKDAVVADTGAILSAWQTMAGGMQSAWTGAVNAAIAESQRLQAATVTAGAGAGAGGGGVQPVVIQNHVSLSRREVTEAVAEDVFREVRRRVGG